ncbi:hypothetical protein [Aestuariivirga sp.]|uniref:hypothetical protein n=1 Tax=Aestuariivirga sp. TaxID=2650926 RepID=UPI0039E67BA3
MANSNATTSTDSITQTTGADTLTVTNTNQIQSTDVFDGAAGTELDPDFGLVGCDGQPDRSRDDNLQEL